MDEAPIARALHVLAVVRWIGGVAFVTTVLLPGIRRLETSAARPMCGREKRKAKFRARRGASAARSQCWKIRAA